MNVLVWGASGGIGSMAVQICKAVGANAIGIVSDDDKIPFVKSLGAVGVLNRKNMNVSVNYLMYKIRKVIRYLLKNAEF